MRNEYGCGVGTTETVTYTVNAEQEPLAPTQEQFTKLINRVQDLAEARPGANFWDELSDTVDQMILDAYTMVPDEVVKFTVEHKDDWADRGLGVAIVSLPAEIESDAAVAAIVSVALMYGEHMANDGNCRLDETMVKEMTQDLGVWFDDRRERGLSTTLALVFGFDDDITDESMQEVAGVLKVNGALAFGAKPVETKDDGLIAWDDLVLEILDDVKARAQQWGGGFAIRMLADSYRAEGKFPYLEELMDHSNFYQCYAETWSSY